MALNKQILDFYKQTPSNNPIVRGNKEMINLYDWKRTDKVLDIGCGAGYDCKAISSKVNDVVGVDIQEDMIKEARKINNALNIEYIQKDFMDWKVADETFHVIMANWSFVHIQDKDALFTKIYKLLRRGGTFLFTDRTIHFQPPNDLLFYNTANQLYNLVSKHGFSNIQYYGEENVIMDGVFSGIYRAIFKASK